MNSRSGLKHLPRVGLALSLAAALAGVTLATTDARACGGCFAPPGAVQTVTDHRMVLAVSSTQTTLWDQFSYAGRPSEFSWILPVRSGPEVRVDLADDRFMQVLDNLTVPTLYAPSRPTRYCGGLETDRGAPSAAGFADAASGGSGVNVYREEVVGPYAIAVVGGTDAMAIRDWLRENGFTVPPVIEPVIDHYVGLRSDFVALKLRAGTSVNRMLPVRVTVPGYAPTLPLRMVAAGIADKVGLSLLVLSNTRFEAMNFPNGEIREADLVWDWNASPTQVPADDFRAAERAINQRNGGRAWITLAAIAQNANLLQNLASNAARVLPGQDGGPVCPPGSMVMPDPDGGTPDGGPAMRCVEPSPSEDMRVALAGQPSEVTITRLRAELSGNLLDRDLQLAPAAVPSPRAREYRYATIRNEPPPPPPCVTPGVARPAIQPIRCNATPGVPGALGLAGWSVLAAAAARLTRRARRGGCDPQG
jgi:hypothetical protein